LILKDGSIRSTVIVLKLLVQNKYSIRSLQKSFSWAVSDFFVLCCLINIKNTAAGLLSCCTFKN